MTPEPQKRPPHRAHDESVVRAEFGAWQKEWDMHASTCKLCLPREELYCPLARRLIETRAALLAELAAALPPLPVKHSTTEL